MRPPDQIPNRAAALLRRGDVCYFWTGKAYSEKTVISPHTNYAAVTIADGNGPMIVKPEEIISAEQFYEEQREDRREKYADLIALWSSGIQDAIALGKSLSTTTSGATSMIAAAKRWGLIQDEPKP